MISQASECDNPVYQLKKDEPSPCDGYLFSPELEKQIQMDINKLRAMEIKMDGLQRVNQLQGSLIENYRVQLGQCENALNTCFKNAHNPDYKYLYMLIGIIAGGVSISLL